MTSSANPKVDPGLQRVEAWLKKCNVAASALGRHVCEDQALISRWRSGGPEAVTSVKRELVFAFIEKHPEGIPGYKRRKGGYKGGRMHFRPGVTDRGPNAGQEHSLSQSTSLPVPGLDHLGSDDLRTWIRNRATAQGVPIVRVLCEMVELGITVTKEIERDDEFTNTDTGESGRDPSSQVNGRNE